MRRAGHAPSRSSSLVPASLPARFRFTFSQIWEQKVQEEREREASRPAATAKLSVMDVVELSEGAGGEERRRPRAMVLKTQGVPGLNKISVRCDRMRVIR